jgi:hypothetical protein
MWMRDQKTASQQRAKLQNPQSFNRLLIYILGLSAFGLLQRATLILAWSSDPLATFFLPSEILYYIVCFAMLASPLLVSGGEIRAWVLRVMALGIFIFCVVCVSPSTRQFEEEQLTIVAENSKPLIAAINRYQKENGSPPRQLSDLVPRYLKLIPSSGVCNNQPFKYSIDSGPLWQLNFRLPINGFDPDEFCFFPGIEPKDFSRRGKNINGWLYYPG